MQAPVPGVTSPWSHCESLSYGLLALNPVLLQEIFVWDLSGNGNLGGKGTLWAGLPRITEQGMGGKGLRGCGEQGRQGWTGEGQNETGRALTWARAAIGSQVRFRHANHFLEEAGQGGAQESTWRWPQGGSSHLCVWGGA